MDDRVFCFFPSAQNRVDMETYQIRLSSFYKISRCLFREEVGRGVTPIFFQYVSTSMYDYR